MVERWHIRVNAKTYGPFDLIYIAQMVERRQIIGSDMVFIYGGSGWVKAENDPTLGALFRHQEQFTSEPEPPVRATGMRRHWTKILLLGFAVTVLWISWPYYAAYSLFIAFRDGDVSVLEDRVAWDSVRLGLRGDLNAFVLGAAGSKKDDPFAIGHPGLAMLFGPAIINQVIDNYLTPQAIAAAKRADASTSSNNGALANIDETVQNARRELQLDQVQYAFFSGGPFTFRIDILPQGDPPPKKPVKLIFKFSGDWKLTSRRFSRRISSSRSFSDYDARTDPI